MDLFFCGGAFAKRQILFLHKHDEQINGFIVFISSFFEPTVKFVRGDYLRFATLRWLEKITKIVLPNDGI